MCLKLVLLEKVGVILVLCLEIDVEYGIECVFYCDDGFELKGLWYIICKEDILWSEIVLLFCVKGVL